MLARYFWAPVAVGLLSIACGGMTASPDGNGNDASTGGSGEDQDGTGGSAATGGQTGGDCQEFRDDAAGSLEVIIFNDRATSVFLGARQQNCGNTPLFTLHDDQDNDVPYAFDSCSGNCETLRQSGPMGCPAACFAADVIEIPPGHARTIDWDTLIRANEALTAECILAESSAQPGDSCIKRERLEPGTFTFRANAGTELDCSQGFDELSCTECDLDAETCAHSGGLVAGDELMAELTVKLDAASGVVDPNAPDDGGSNNGVKLRFTD